MNYVTVGLDLSLTSSGFCLLQESNVTIETIKTTPKTCENDLARLAYIRKEIMGRIPSNISMICIEDFFTPSNPFQIGAAIGLAMLGAIVRMALWEATMPFYVVSPPQLKKYATGKGTGQKSLILREVYKKWGLDCKDDNQADACVLAHVAQELAWYPMVGENEPKYQTEVIEKIIKERPRYNIVKA